MGADRAVPRGLEYSLHLLDLEAIHKNCGVSDYVSDDLLADKAVRNGCSAAGLRNMVPCSSLR